MKVTDLKENEVIHCKNEEQANAICKLMHEAGLKWNSSFSYLNDNKFKDYKKQTCYNPKEGKYSYLDYYKREGYTIYKAEHFLNIKKTMTKTRVLFEEVEEKKLKPIEFKSLLDYDLKFESRDLVLPRAYSELILITRNYANSLDIILAKDKDQEDVLYLGHWNDGVVE